MTKPVRLQLSRRKGASLQAASRALNGLDAVVVARPSKWGNPYRVTGTFAAADAVTTFRALWEAMLAPEYPGRRVCMESLADLRGKNLACWCKPGAPCHADVLLDLANRGKNT